MITCTTLQNRVQQHGFSLLETLIAAMLMVLLLVPALQSLATFSHVSTERNLHEVRMQSIQEKMDELLAMNFESMAELAANHDTLNTSLSDPAGTPQRRVVYISHYDGDASGTVINPFVEEEKDADLIWINVTITGVEDNLSTLVRRP